MNGATPTPSPPDDPHGPGSLPGPEPTPSSVPDGPHPVEPSPSPLPEPTPDPVPAPVPDPAPVPQPEPVPGTEPGVPQPAPDTEPGVPQPDPDTEPDPQPLSPPDPIDPPEPEPEPFADGPPPLPKPMLVLDGELPEHDPPPAPAEPVDHGTCPACGGAYDEDGWCTQCGERKADPSHHVTAQPAPHVAAVCDRGRRHTSNEDAMAVWADADDPTTAALVVCDGVSSASRSAEASRAAADAALQVLLDVQLTEPERIVAATDAAAAAVEALAAEHPGEAPSCTYVAGLLVGGRITVGSVGDSRAYWLPDEGTPVRLTTDDSMAEEHVQAGVSRAEAEAGPMAHTITRWLGPDAPDHTPHLTEQDASVPGWMVLCSDGLWNYASEAEDLHAVVRAEQERVGSDPLELAEALVAWANARGGVDNITVALARTGDARQDGVHG